jgi:penicillin-binding protein 1A
MSAIRARRSAPRSTRGFRGSRARVTARRRTRQRRRSRSSRCARTARSSRWSAAGITPPHPSTASRRRGASRGSTFKLFVYLAALADGKSPDDLIDNRAIDTGAYQPKNSGGVYSDTITLENAFATSSNVAAVRLFREVGDDKVIRMARDLGVTSPLAKGDPSLALGTSSMTLLELTAAYAAVAANSYPVLPHAFAEEEPGWFERWIWGPDHFSTRVHDDIEQMLRAAVNRGTGRAARLPQANFGKTGTTQDSRDALFVGYANGLVVGIWIGNDDNTPLHGAAGGGIPARIWRDFMMQASGRAAAPVKKAPRPADPAGPVQPLDIPDIPEVPIADKTSVGVKDGNAVISTEIGGTKIDLKLPIGDRPPSTPPAQSQPPPAQR